MKKYSLVTLAFAAVAVVHGIWASRVPVGIFYDDALHLLLARALIHGSFSLPDGRVLTEPLPGFAALLALPAALVSPHYELLRVLAVGITWFMVFLTWRLARRLLSPGLACAAALLVAANTALAMYCGALMPDIAYTAASLAALLALDADHGIFLVAAAALAALLRPHGILLMLSLGAAIGVCRGIREGAQFLAPALLVPAAWGVRGLLAPGAGGYLPLWERYAEKLSRPSDLLLHAARLLWVLGAGLLNADPPGWAAAIIGAGLLWIAMKPVLRERRSRRRPAVLAMGFYIAAVLLLHLSWPFESFRYFIPLLPLVWILALAEAGPRLERRPVFALALSAVLAGLAVGNWRAYFPAAGAPPTLWPETMSWIRANTAEDARFQSVYDAPVMLFASRTAEPFSAQSLSRAQWLEACRTKGIRYVLVNLEVGSRIQEGPGLATVYRNDKEDSRLFELEAR